MLHAGVGWTTAPTVKDVELSGFSGLVVCTYPGWDAQAAGTVPAGKGPPAPFGHSTGSWAAPRPKIVADLPTSAGDGARNPWEKVPRSASQFDGRHFTPTLGVSELP